MAESSFDLCEVQNEVPEEHLQTLLDTLPPFRLELFGKFEGIVRLFEGKEEGKWNEKRKKREKGEETLVFPAKVAKKQTIQTKIKPASSLQLLPRKLESSAELYATLGLLAKH